MNVRHRFNIFIAIMLGLIVGILVSPNVRTVKKIPVGSGFPMGPSCGSVMTGRTAATIPALLRSFLRAGLIRSCISTGGFQTRPRSA